MNRRDLLYDDQGHTLRAHVVCDELGEPAPCVIVAHAWRGQDDFARSRARALAAQGYVAVALDMYGPDQLTTDPAQARAWMTPFVEDRALCRRRLHAALALARGLDEVDASRVAIVGYCFGGLCALELARSGADIRAAISVHGLLRPALAPDGPITASVMLLHGDADPMAPPEDLRAASDELNEAGADWVCLTFGGAMHAFTMPAANNPAGGVLYDARADRRAHAAIQGWLAACFDA